MKEQQWLPASMALQVAGVLFVLSVICLGGGLGSKGYMQQTLIFISASTCALALIMGMSGWLDYRVLKLCPKCQRILGKSAGRCPFCHYEPNEEIYRCG